MRSLVKLARTIGAVSWSLEVKNVKSESYRDTRGPGSDGFALLLTEVKSRNGEKAVRDYAILRLLFDLGLRRGEVVSLDVEDVDLANGTVAVLGKGRTEKTRLTLPEQTKLALAAWLETHGSEPGPLFTNFHHAFKGGRLTGTSVYRIVRDLGRSVGVETRPHGVRHAAITEALNLTQGDVRAVQRFSRHRDIRTLNTYDDSRRDLGGDVAKKVAALV